MSRRRPGSQPQKSITHPNDPSISVIVRKPRRAEFERLNVLLQDHRTVRLVYDNDNKVAKDKDGEDKMYIDQFWPNEANIESARIHVVAISGLLGENDVPLTREEGIAELYEEWLDCKDVDEPVKDPAPGEPTTKKVSMSFGKFISQQMAKENFFDPDPTATDSAPS